MEEVYDALFMGGIYDCTLHSVPSNVKKWIIGWFDYNEDYDLIFMESVYIRKGDTFYYSHTN